MGRTACTEPQCLYKGDLYLYLYVMRQIWVVPTVILEGQKLPYLDKTAELIIFYYLKLLWSEHGKSKMSLE
jgi:hypothetical protein